MPMIVENCHLLNNGGDGLRISGFATLKHTFVIRNAVASGNGGDGIRMNFSWEREQLAIPPEVSDADIENLVNAAQDTPRQTLLERLKNLDPWVKFGSSSVSLLNGILDLYDRS